MAKRKQTHLEYYVIFDDQERVYIRKYLSKVQELTNFDSRTLSKHFSRTNKPYIKGGFTVHKTKNVDLKSYNSGNMDNLSSAQY